LPPSSRVLSWLPSWLLSWLPFAYSPFSMGCIDVCNEYIAVDECIELCSNDVKKKTTDEWKNRQQLFPDPRAVPFRCTHFMHPSTQQSEFFSDAALRSFLKSAGIVSSRRFIHSTNRDRPFNRSACAKAA
jgi:hypothetical protein